LLTCLWAWVLTGAVHLVLRTGGFGAVSWQDTLPLDVLHKSSLAATSIEDADVRADLGPSGVLVFTGDGTGVSAGLLLSVEVSAASSWD